MEGNYFVTASHDYEVSPEQIYAKIKGGKLFELTGARNVKFDFSENGPFELAFDNGKVTGRFLSILPNSKVILEWDAEGFGRNPEKGTKVWITILGQETRSNVTIEHREIPTEASAIAKKKSWEEILEGLR